MKKFALLLFAALTSLSSFAQQLVSADNSQHTLLSPPAFPGGDSAMLQFLSANIMYPKLAKENKIQGVAVLAFTVGLTGKVSDIEIIKDPGVGCAAEAARVVAAMPDWVPGRDERGPVKVRYTLPVRYRLEDPMLQKKKRFRDRKTLFGYQKAQGIKLLEGN